MRALPALFLLAVLLAASPVHAGCVSCGPGGECYEASAGFSANCECRIRSVNGVAICKPSGVCDASDSTTCAENPWTNVAPGTEISTKVVDQLAPVSPRAAGAVWDAFTEQRGTAKPQLSPGTYSGTMGQEGRSFTFQTTVRQTGADSFALSIRVEEDGTGQVEEYEAALLKGGRRGHVLRLGHDGGRERILTWRAGER